MVRSPNSKWNSRWTHEVVLLKSPRNISIILLINIYKVEIVVIKVSILRYPTVHILNLFLLIPILRFHLPQLPFLQPLLQRYALILQTALNNLRSYLICLFQFLNILWILLPFGKLNRNHLFSVFLALNLPIKFSFKLHFDAIGLFLVHYEVLHSGVPILTMPELPDQINSFVQLVELTFWGWHLWDV